MLLDEIASAALLGTRRCRCRLPALPDELAAALPTGDSDPELQLLDAAAGATLHAPPVAFGNKGWRCRSLAPLIVGMNVRHAPQIF